MSRTARSAAPLAAYVLHRWDWSETSLIVELFTRAQGRVVVVAKGAKRPTSQLRPVLLPFQPLTALLGRTPADDSSEIHTLRSAEWAGGEPLLPAAALLSGCYLNELLMKLLARQDPHPGLYDAYVDTLRALARIPASNASPASPAGPGADPGPGAGAGEAVALRAFELRLLRETGLLPDLASVAAGATLPRADLHYGLHAETGLVLARAPGAPLDVTPDTTPNTSPNTAPHTTLSGAAWLSLQAALDHGDPAALRAACAPVVTALRGPLRTLLHYHLGHSALRTRQVGRDMQRLLDVGTAPNRTPAA